MKMMMLAGIISLCMVPLYAADQVTKKGYAGHYVIKYEEATIKEKTGFYYIFYGTQGVSKNKVIAYAEDVATLTARYDLSQKQLEELLYQQAAHIKGLEYLNQQLVDVNQKLIKLSESTSKINKSVLSNLVTAQELALNAHNALVSKNKIINVAIRLIGCGIALGISMQLYQWYGMY